MNQVDEWLAAHEIIECIPYRVKMVVGKCADYQDRNPDACIGCARYKGGGGRRRTSGGYFVRWYEEVSMDGVKDLFVKPSPKREITKAQAQVTTEIKDRIAKIAEKTGYPMEKVCEAFIMEGLRAYDEAAKN